MRKTLLIIAIVVLALVPIAAFALVANSPARVAVRQDIQAPAARQELTDQQKADLASAVQKSIDLRKETIDTMVQDGLLTEEEGTLMKERLDERAADYAENGYANGYGGMLRGCVGFDLDDDDNAGYYGRGMMRGYGARYWD